MNSIIIIYSVSRLGSTLNYFKRLSSSHRCNFKLTKALAVTDASLINHILGAINESKAILIRHIR